MTPLRSGFRSSEYWATVAVAGLGAALALPDGAPTWRVVVGVAAAVIPVLFYQAHRTSLKQPPDSAP